LFAQPGAATGRWGFLAALRSSMARDELFAGVCCLGCVNGLVGRVIQSIDLHGWKAALLAGFDISAIVWCACGAGLLFVLREKPEPIRSADLFVTAGALALIMLPTAAISWAAVTGVTVYILAFTDAPPSRRRGGVILLATTVPMLWSRLVFHFLATPILNIDAAFVGWVLGTNHIGNMVRFADGSGDMMISPACSSLANISHGFLCWVVISQLVGRRWASRDLLWCAAILGAMIAVNVARISLEGLSTEHYKAIHNSWQGNTVVNLLGLGVAVGISLCGVRRELFSHA
jgi:hypothetical protein